MGAPSTVESFSNGVRQRSFTLDGLRAVDGLDGPVGFGGTSMGAMIGIPLIAAERRIRAAVLGLVGHGFLAETAALDYIGTGGATPLRVPAG